MKDEFILITHVESLSKKSHWKHFFLSLNMHGDKIAVVPISMLIKVFEVPLIF